jgi:hypothetical protein
VGGRSIIRDTDGEAIVDLAIDVTGGRLSGAWGRGADRQTVDEAVALQAGTYWGPLIFIVIKNFDANAEEGRLAFRTVAPTPKPYVVDLQIARDESTRVERAGVGLETVRFDLDPTVHWAVDPLIRLSPPARASTCSPASRPRWCGSPGHGTTAASRSGFE